MGKSINAKDLFDFHAVQYENKFMDVSDYSLSLHALLALISESNSRLLELGCGPGNITKFLHELQPKLQILGIDIAPNMIELAAKNNPRAAFQIMDCKDILKLHRKFDVIIGGFCMPYLNEIECEELIRNSSRMLEIDGIIYLSTMEEDKNHSTGFQSSPNSDHTILINYHNPEFLEKVLEDSGFKIEHFYRQENIDQNGLLGIDLIFIARYMGGN